MEQTLQNIRDYVETTREDAMDIDNPPHVDMEERLNETLKYLHERVRNQQAELEKLRSESSSNALQTPSSNPRERLKQLKTIKTAYNQLTPSKPDLPTPSSLLPVLLATRTIQETIMTSKSTIPTTHSTLSKTLSLLAREESDLADTTAISTALTARLTRLRVASSTQSLQSPTDLAREALRGKQSLHRHLERETTALRNAFIAFVDAHLAPLLAAEELGGPVVGELADVDDDVLSAGFSAQGRPAKQRRAGGDAEAKAEEKRQRRIDEIWGPAATAGEGEQMSEKEAAAAELHGLVEDLFNALLGGLGSGGGSYVMLERDSAAARFLVRSRIAVFHPKDAMKLRLVDFGRTVDE
ncbi:hypothetical protein K402DRAFT_445494 [Aulographum hederae CBS 113979]|uniref:Centromere protein Cenp-K n=1 Tax=Aulographum hederae CBS 113979 TaxID=1176131 RepID=A0A6G1H5A1_9PEZI|nr:hypothetical protein K402DRAFT_445494 [Aulographum hederae CBS 113979]